MSDEPITLDPNDAFDRLLIPIVLTNRAKRADYATPGDLYTNFRRNSFIVALDGFTPLVDCISMVARKLGRITNLRGRDPQNETVLDSYLDLAVYAILAYGLATEEADAAKKIDEGTSSGVEGPLHYYQASADTHPSNGESPEPGEIHSSYLSNQVRH